MAKLRIQLSWIHSSLQSCKQRASWCSTSGDVQRTVSELSPCGGQGEGEAQRADFGRAPQELGRAWPSLSASAMPKQADSMQNLSCLLSWASEAQKQMNSFWMWARLRIRPLPKRWFECSLMNLIVASFKILLSLQSSPCTTQINCNRWQSWLDIHFPNKSQGRVKEPTRLY